MKMLVEAKTVQRSGVQEVIKCSMAHNAHAFQLLVRQYSDPIKAIMQEIGANAADAHSRINKQDVPFTVTLPNVLDPHLRIRDYGCSMTPEKIRDIYAVYMKSDKCHTDNETGAFGLGKVTPLAYTDMFNVSTFIDGIKRLYTYGFDELGMPEINVFGEFPTKEENGVEISFSVKKGDWKKFEDAARHVFAFFDTPPVVNGIDGFALNTYEKVFEGDEWYISGQYKDSYVIMGNIAYKVESYHLQDSRCASLLNNGIHFKMPMGKVNMTPSREALEYSKLTIDSISARLKEIADGIDALAVEKLNKCKSAFEASIMFRTLKGKTDLGINVGKCKHVIVNSVVIGDMRCTYKQNYNGNVSKIKAPWNNQINILPNIRYVIKDIERGFELRSKHVVLKDNVVIKLFNPTITKKDLMHKLGAVAADNVVFLASELDAPPKNATIKGKRVKKTTKDVFKFCITSSSCGSSYDAKWWNEETIDPKVGEHVYITMDRYRPSNLSNHNIKTVLDVLKKTKMQVIGLNSKNAKLADRKNFIPFKEWAIKELDKMIDPNILVNYVKYSTYHQLKHMEMLVYLNNSNTRKFSNQKNPLCLLMKFVKDFSKSKNDKAIKNLIGISNIVGYTLKGGAVDKSVIALQKEVQDKYPLVVSLFEVIGNSTWRLPKGMPNQVIDNINFLDSKGS